MVSSEFGRSTGTVVRAVVGLGEPIELSGGVRSAGSNSHTPQRSLSSKSASHSVSEGALSGSQIASDFSRLSAGGRWIRTSSTWAPVNRVIPLLCCPIAWDELTRARVLLGSYDLTREEIWVNLIDRDRPHGLKEPARDPGGASVGVALLDDLDADLHAFDR